ncbi:peptide/nickel transport system substrate-binding protein [Arcanobacterium wilhelmae]|uniref:Peptide/nickel transport system substrate-binding protein n=1 Tax=Arcanobacterium wilhelmae TaxID=1803177 RepID=A0ABT9NC63_9ACTO|nr:ABC transporter family substrate-binding protein [Arcanobacterium wilhelmae]MDP9801314.1 peptide/nickel transport system substrate-binding protein [Arcanobacterium wilhelmae]WFN90655.1 ABC transporter family substrate-binding protein [Arcanobacterium wilhelmae]
MQVKKTAGIALVAATALVLGACGGGTTDAKKSNSNELKASDYDKVDPANLQDGGNLRLALSAMPVNYNAMNVNGNTSDVASRLYGFIAPINWVYDAKGQAEPNKDYLLSADAAGDGTDASPFTVKLKLNDKAKWNDGTPITAADYKATWEACNGEAHKDYECTSTDGWTSIKDVKAGATPFDVEVDFKTAYPDWKSLVGGPMPAKGISNAKDFNEGWKTIDKARDLMTGPFKLKAIDDKAGVITLERNPNWWGSKPKLENVTFKVLDAKAQGTAYANKELDVVETITDAATYETAKKRQDGTVRVSAGTQWRHFTFNSRADSLKDEAFRNAIIKGINTAKIAASDLAGLPSAKYDVALGNHFFMPNQAAYKDNSVKYDPKAAMADLEKLGYKKNGDFYEKDGKKAGFSFLSIPGVPASENEAQLLKAQMKEIGVDVTVKTEPSATFFDKVIGGEFEATAFAWQGTPYPMANVNQIYGKPFDDKGKLQNSNFTGLEVPEVDKLIPQIAKETDNAKRVDMTNEADKIIWSKGMVLPLYFRPLIQAQPKNLANYGPTAFETMLPENIGFTK